MMYVKAPSNIGRLQSIIMLIATFEIIPDEWYRDYIWFWKEEENISARLEAVGLDSYIFMLSMGLPFYVFGVALLLLLVAVAMQICSPKQTPTPDQQEGGSSEEI